MKNISFKIEDDFHKEVKLKATEQGISIKEFIIQLIQKELEKKK